MDNKDNFRRSENKKILKVIILTTLVIIAFSFILMKITDVVIIRKDSLKNVRTTYEKYKKLNEIESLIEKDYLYKDKLKSHDERMEDLYIKLTKDAGDKYTRYLTKEDRKTLEEGINSSFSGVGIVIGLEGKKIIVKDVIEGSPADSCKVKSGDVITKINGKKCSNLSEAVKELRGKEGTSISVTFDRKGKTETKQIIRGKIDEGTIKAGVIDKENGYMRISSFGKDTAKDAKNYMKSLEDKGYKGIIIDLRNNPGGLLKESLDIADYLLPQCLMISTTDKNGKKKNYNSEESKTKLKYVILVNGGSASASEVLTAAIKDNKGGKIIGNKTYGKGVIQNTYMFKDGTGISITSKEYLSPKGYHINGKGINPDIIVNLDKKNKNDLQLKRAIKELKKEEK